MPLKKQIRKRKNNWEGNVMRDIIIDCDPGHDDAIAILLAAAFKEKLNILGLTTVGGNQYVERVTENALKIKELIGLEAPVIMGSEKPLIKSLRVAPEAHGETGMDGPILPKPKVKPLKVNVVKWLYETIMSAEEKVTLVPIAPLTNIALLLHTYPEVKEKIELISLMGGGIHLGNVTPAAEFNIYVDPDAAKIVFESGIPIVMSGLDVTNKAYLKFEAADQLKSKGRYSNFVGELLDFYSLYGKKHGYPGNSMHDPCAVAYLINEELFKGKKYHVMVETNDTLTRGMTLADNRIEAKEEDKNVKVLLDVDREKFEKLIFEALERLDLEV